MENIEIILSLAGTIIGLLITATTFLFKFINNAKAKKLAEQIIKIGNAVIPYIEKAEEYTDFSGEEKKEYVLTKANQYAIDNAIPFDRELVSNKIEELVILTKTVNKREKDKASLPAV